MKEAVFTNIMLVQVNLDLDPSNKTLNS